VPLVTLDEIIDKKQQVDLIKIDAEGAELDIITADKGVLATNPDIALIVEFGPSHILRAGQSIKQWFDVFSQLGLCCRVINAYSGELEEWSMQQLEKTHSVNLFFAREDSAAWERMST
jgi:hypothetical protein